MNEDQHGPPGPTPEERDRLRAIATHLIPEAHGMPAAGTVLTDGSIAFVLGARPDLTTSLRRGLGAGLPTGVAERLEHLARTDPDALAAVHLVVVGGYYADNYVRNAIGYPGQLARAVSVLGFPRYIEEGLIDAVVARGPIWRDPDAIEPEL